MKVSVFDICSQRCILRLSFYSWFVITIIQECSKFKKSVWLNNTYNILFQNEVENLSCYCSASHTDTISTDEHDSIRDNHEQFSKGNIHQSDSGADLTDFGKSDADIEWNKYWSVNGEKLIWESWIGKFSAYINPDYLQYAQENAEEADIPASKHDFLNKTIL